MTDWLPGHSEEDQDVSNDPGRYHQTVDQYESQLGKMQTWEDK